MVMSSPRSAWAGATTKERCQPVVLFTSATSATLPASCPALRW